MFDFLNKKILKDNKKLVYQNFFGSHDIIEYIQKDKASSHYQIFPKEYKDRDDRFLEKLSSIKDFSSKVRESWGASYPLSQNVVKELFRYNYILRSIYKERFRAESESEFDRWIDPSNFGSSYDSFYQY